MIYQLPACGICGRACIPMADYDLATCVRCDADVDALLLRASMPDAFQLREQVDLTRPLHTYYGPAPACVVEELVEALFPSAPHRRTAADQPRGPGGRFTSKSDTLGVAS